jgi:Glycoside-hydrolase family GH114
MRRTHGHLVVALATGASVALAACASTPGTSPPGPGPGAGPPPAGAPFDYQLGGPYEPRAGTEVVVRDREASPAAGLYNVCYVNAFQTQEHELAWWEHEHPALLLGDDDGYVVDGDWNEVLLDISSARRRAALADVVGTWIEGCAADGFDAVEPDNLDSYTRSDGLLSGDDAAAFAALLAERAHAAGLAIAQKNGAELAPRGPSLGFDFAVVEECNRWSECDAYTEAYGDALLVIEYRAADFATGCAEWPDLSIVHRDLDVRPAGSDGYVYDAC